MMELLKQIKLYFNKFSFCCLLIFVFTIDVKAINNDIYVKSSEYIKINNISYDYQIFDNHGIDCVGTLSLDIELPQNVSNLIFERSKCHLLEIDSENFHPLAKSELAISNKLNIPSIYWGTYFRLCVVLTNGTHIYSPIFSINDYINPLDLDYIISQASIEDTYLDSICMYLNNHHFLLNSPEKASLLIYDSKGHLMFGGEVQGYCDIPIINSISPVVIIMYKSSNKSIIRKLLLQ